MRKTATILTLAVLVVALLGLAMLWSPTRAPHQAEPSGDTEQTAKDRDAGSKASRQAVGASTAPRLARARHGDIARPNLDDTTAFARAFNGEISLSQALSERFEREQLNVQQRDALRRLTGSMCAAVAVSAEADAESLRKFLSSHLLPEARGYCRGFDSFEQVRDIAWDSSISPAPTPRQRQLIADAQAAADAGAEAEGINLLLAQLDAALYRADYPMIVAAIAELIRQRWLAPPIAEAPHSVQMYDTRLSVFAANVLLCERLGGCGPRHPLTLQVCLYDYENMRCRRPQNIDHAIAQAESGLRYQVLHVLVADLRRLLAGRGSLGS